MKWEVSEPESAPASCPEPPFVVFCCSPVGFTDAMFGSPPDSFLPRVTRCTTHPHPLTPHALQSHPPSCTLAHRVNKGNSKHIISKEKQFLLQQASLSVLLGTLRKQSGRNVLELGSVSSRGCRPGILHVTPSGNWGSSPLSLECLFPSHRQVSLLCSRVPLVSLKQNV